MKRVPLTAELRGAGKSLVKRMRTEGRVPAILYGKAVAPVMISVNRREVEDIVKGEAGMNAMIDLTVKGGDSGLALIRDYQADPFRRDFTHIDFQAISLKDRIEVEVPIEITGKAIGVKEGGMLEQLRRTLLIRSLPDRIPMSISIDISELKIGDSIHANEVKLPDGVEFPQKMNFTLVSVVPPTKIEEAKPAVAAVPVEGEVVPGAPGAPTPEGAAAAPAAAPGAEAPAPATEKAPDKAAKKKKE